MPPPKSWDEFEVIVCAAAKNRWKNADFTMHGRRGQRQNGVDVYGLDDKGRLVGLQCKSSASGLTENVIKTEIGAAESFRPALKHLYIATTAETDKVLQELARDISADRVKLNKFEVSILFWQDVWDDLTRDESRLLQHYPQLRQVAMGAVGAPSRSFIQEYLQKNISVLGYLASADENLAVEIDKDAYGYIGDLAHSMYYWRRLCFDVEMTSTLTKLHDSITAIWQIISDENYILAGWRWKFDNTPDLNRDVQAVLRVKKTEIKPPLADFAKYLKVLEDMAKN